MSAGVLYVNGDRYNDMSGWAELRAGSGVWHQVVSEVDQRLYFPCLGVWSESNDYMDYRWRPNGLRERVCRRARCQMEVGP